jgi:hypothetical protein
MLFVFIAGKREENFEMTHNSIVDCLTGLADLDVVGYQRHKHDHHEFPVYYEIHDDFY